MRLWALCISLILPIAVSATELMPWFGNDKEFEWRTSYRFQRYGTAHSFAGRTDFDGYGHYLTTGLAISPAPCLAVEFEGGLSRTDFDHGVQVHAGILTVRHNVCNDIVGDPVALTLGATFYFPTSMSVRDVGSLYHTELDSELHVSIGQETACGRSWSTRYWAVFAAGIGLEDSPWLRFHISHEWNCNDCHLVRLFYTVRGGLGDDALDLTQRFEGYGSIRYRIMEAGGRYTWIIPYHGECAVELTQRVWALHAPSTNLNIEFIYLKTFGL